MFLSTYSTGFLYRYTQKSDRLTASVRRKVERSKRYKERFDEFVAKSMSLLRTELWTKLYYRTFGVELSTPSVTKKYQSKCICTCLWMSELFLSKSVSNIARMNQAITTLRHIRTNDKRAF